MASTVTTFDFALKEWYTKDRIEQIIFSDRPWLGMLKKETEFQGRGHPVPVLYRGPQGVAVTLTDAQSNKTNVVGDQFMVTAGDVAAAVDIGDKVIRASRSNPGAFLQNSKVEIDNLYELVSDVLAIAAAGNGGQALGRASGAISGLTFTLQDKADIHKIHVGMVLESSTGDGSSTSDTLDSGTATVTAIDLAAGTFTVNADPSWGSNQYFFRRGMFYGNTTDFVMHGVQSYVWTDASNPGAVYGMSAATRLNDRVRLAGMAVPSADLTGKGIEERIQILGSRLTGRGMAPGAETYMLNPEDWQSLAIALQSRGQRALTDESTKFGYKYLSVIAGAKEAKIFADRYFPAGVVFGLKKDTFTLYSLEELVSTLNGDDLTMLRKTDANDYEYRLVSYPGLGCVAPGHNGRAPL